MHPRTVRVELQDVRAIFFFRRGVRIIDIRCRSHSDEHLFAIRTEPNIAGPVPIGVGKVDNVLRRPACLQVSTVIWKTHDRVRVSDVHPLRTLSGRIEGNPIGPVKALSECIRLLGCAIGRDAPKNLNFPGAAFCQKDVAVGCRPKLSGPVETRGVLLDNEARGRLWPRVWWTPH